MFKVGDRVWLINDKSIAIIKMITKPHSTQYYMKDMQGFWFEDEITQSAQTMFEELGYEKEEDLKNERIIYKWEDSLEIIFSLKEKEVWLERIGDMSGEYILEINEHLAIHQKLIELGWIE